MKTEHWIDLLAADATPVDPHAHTKRMGLTLAAGTVAAALIAGQSWGWRTYEAHDLSTAMLWVRWAFCLSVIAAACQAVDRLARPGTSLQGVAMRVALPFGLLLMLAFAQLFTTDPQDRLELLMGSTALQCPTNIAKVSVPVFIASLWVMRRMAPTRAAWAGAASGLLAGGVGALGYTFHCTELAAPFLSVWYVLGMAIPTALGAVIGSRLLRW